MLKIEATGKNVEGAIDNALFELKAVREDVDITILDEGGFLRKAKVSVKISDDCMEKYLRKQDSFYEEEQVQTNEKPLKQEVKVSKTIETEEKPKAKRNPSAESGKAGQAFLQGLLQTLGAQGEVEMSQNGRDIYYDVVGDNLSALIGHRGETMYAVQFILSILESRVDRNVGRVLLNVDRYKEHREVQLTDLANRQAEKCKTYNKVIKMEPMNSYERKIVHTALQSDNDVTTHSEGEEPRRYLVITPKKKEVALKEEGQAKEPEQENVIAEQTQEVLNEQVLQTANTEITEEQVLDVVEDNIDDSELEEIKHED